jgi:hypothetical protein
VAGHGEISRLDQDDKFDVRVAARQTLDEPDSEIGLVDCGYVECNT